MIFDIQDTIVALASASGPGGRAIVRLSGSEAFEIAWSFFRPDTKKDSTIATRHSSLITHHSPLTRRRHEGCLHLPRLRVPIPASLLTWPAPRTYTGQNLAELHLLSCPPLVDLLVTSLMNGGARAAQPGEFTMRAFLAGKLDLPRAEAVLAVIEAGLDFAEEDIRFVQPVELLHRLAKGLAQVTLLSKQLEKRAMTDSAFRVVLAGRPNAGKSSLFNALTGAAALVSPEPGTTRDYLVRRMMVGETAIDLIDTAGWREHLNSIEEQAQKLGKHQTEEADLILLCLEAGLEIRGD